MAPTALSQLIGQLAKLTAGLILAAVLLPKGPVYAASGALLGVSLSELLSLIYLAAVSPPQGGPPRCLKRRAPWRAKAIRNCCAL